MPIDIYVNDDDLDEVRAEISKIQLGFMRAGSKIANRIADALVITTKNRINAMGLYDTGELYDSVGKIDMEDVIEVFVDANHAAPLEFGSGIYGPEGLATPGRYVPDIGVRLVHPTRRVILWGTLDTEIEIENPLGLHEGNEPFRFFEQSVTEILSYPDETWLYGIGEEDDE